MTFPPGPSKNPSSDMIVETTSLRMVHPSRWRFELSPDERRRQRRTRRSGRKTF
jgi:hypothetical protein